MSENCQGNPGSSAEQMWKNLSTRCCIPSFNVIGHLVPKKKIFEVYFPSMGLEAILVIVPLPLTFNKITHSVTKIGEVPKYLGVLLLERYSIIGGRG